MIIASLENPSFSNPTEASECIPFSKEDSVSVTAIKPHATQFWYRFCFWETRLSLLPKTDSCGTLRTIWSETWQRQIYFFLHLRCQENWDRYSLAFAGIGCSTVCSMQSFVKQFTLFKTFQPLHRYKTLWFLRLIARYTGVVSPFRKPFISLQRLKFVIALIWLISMGAYTRHFFIAWI